MQSWNATFFLFFVIRCGAGISGRVRALNLTVGQTISGTGRVRASVLSPCRPLIHRPHLLRVSAAAEQDGVSVGLLWQSCRVLQKPVIYTTAPQWSLIQRILYRRSRDSPLSRLSSFKPARGTNAVLSRTPQHPDTILCCLTQAKLHRNHTALNTHKSYSYSFGKTYYVSKRFDLITVLTRVNTINKLLVIIKILNNRW